MAKAVRGVTRHGTEAGETLTGTDGSDSLLGYGGDDTLNSGAGNDNLYGHEGQDTLNGGAGNDTLHGNEGGDTLFGGEGDDFLAGQEGDDQVFGGAGNDVIGWGGTGHDELTGGSGNDRFYSGAWAWNDQQVGSVLIKDFESGIDKLDLTRFDANESTTPGIIKGNNTPGNEAFTYVTQTNEMTPGHLTITTSVDELGNPITIVRGYTDAVAGADIEIILSGVDQNGSPIIAPTDILF